MFNLKLDTSNDVFQEGLKEETVRILKEVAEKVIEGADHSNILDLNGNHVGYWELNKKE